MEQIIIEYLFNKEMINSSELSTYLYGLEIIKLKLTHFIIIFLISILFDLVLHILLFLLSYSNIRAEIGGYHANSKITCILFSVIMVIFTCLLTGSNIYISSEGLFIVLCVLGLCYIHIMELRKFFKVLTPTILLCIFLMIINYKSYIISILCSLFFALFFRVLMVFKIKDMILFK